MSANPGDFLLALARDSFAAAVLVLLVLVTQHVFRKQLSPRWQCALWLLVVARLLPISFNSDISIFNLLPRWAAGSSATAVAAPAKLDLIAMLLSPPAIPAIPSSTNDDATTTAVPVPVVRASDFFANGSWPIALFFGWLAGVLVLGVYVTVVSVSLARSLARLKSLDDPAALDVLHDCCARMGLRRTPILMESGAVHTPALHGLLRPRLLLPVGFSTTYSLEEQRFVFLHELAHLRRHDLLLNWIMTGLQIMHWFNPLVWFGFARWRVDREIACDAAALEAAGAGSTRAYGRTILRVLQNFSAPNPQPGLIGILEDKRQLQRRMKMIALFAPARRPFVAAGLLAILAIVGLTDAQVAPTPAPVIPSAGVATSPTPAPVPGIAKSWEEHPFLKTAEIGKPVGPFAAAIREQDPPFAQMSVAPEAPPTVPYTLFLVSGAETMLGETNAEVALRRQQTEEQRRAAPKWDRTVQTLQASLKALAPGTVYQVMICRDASVLSMGVGSRESSGDDVVINGIARRLRGQAPFGGFDLNGAFGSALHVANRRAPERIVLITDGLPTAGEGVRNDDSVTEAQRIKLFEAAIKTLPPRIPVHTVLLPAAPGDPGAAGLYWELANATRGALTCPAKPGSAPRTHLAFVVDTSGSMRDPNRGGLWPIVIDTIDTTLDAHPQLMGVQLLDGDGRFILGRKGSGSAAWLANTSDTRDAIKRALRRYEQDTVSNPVPGTTNAIRFLHDKDAPDMRMGICIFGDEFNSREPADVVIRQLNELNPPDAAGQRPIVINAFGFPTTIRYQFSMGNTGLRFANLMRIVADEHGGAFIALPDL